MSNITLENIELRELEKNNFELLFHFSNDSHYLMSFKKGEIVEKVGCKLYSFSQAMGESKNGLVKSQS